MGIRIIFSGIMIIAGGAGGTAVANVILRNELKYLRILLDPQLDAPISQIVRDPSALRTAANRARSRVTLVMLISSMIIVASFTVLLFQKLGYYVLAYNALLCLLFAVATSTGMFIRGIVAHVQIKRAQFVFEVADRTRSSIVGSISESQVKQSELERQAAAARAEELFKRNLQSQFELKSVEIKRAGIFHELEWNFEPGVNVLLGRNGYGKSFLLRLLVGALSYDNERLANLLVRTTPDSKLEPMQLAVSLLKDGSANAIVRGPDAFDESVGKIPLLAIPDSRFMNRTRDSVSPGEGDFADLKQFGAHHFLYDLPYDTTIQTVFAQMCIDYFRVGVRNAPPQSDQLDLVSNMVYELSGERFRFQGINAIGSAKFSILVETDASPGQPIPIQKVSQGTLSVVAIGALIYQYLRKIHPNAQEGEVRKQRGIVVIDEVDAHLHPAWQRQITRMLTKHFPRVQFILTAHSPLVVAGSGRGEVSVLRREKDGLTIVEYQKDFIGASIDEIYREVFEIEERDPVYQDYHAQIPHLGDLNRELASLRSNPADPKRVEEITDQIGYIERTRQQQEVRIDQDSVKRENEQLRRQIDAYRKAGDIDALIRENAQLKRQLAGRHPDEKPDSPS